MRHREAIRDRCFARTHTGTLGGFAVLILASLFLHCGGGKGANPLPTPVPDFSFSVATPCSLASGGTGTAVVNVVRSGGHTAVIQLRIADNAQGITGTGNVSSESMTGSLGISVPALLATGTYSLIVSGDDGHLTRTTTFNLGVTTPIPSTWSSPFGFHPASAGGYGDAQNLGITWTREGLYAFWFLIQPDLSTQNYDFSQYDAQWKRVPAGINIMGNIAPQGNLDEGRCLPGSFFPVDESKYIAFVKAVVRRYDGDGVDDMSGLVNPIKVWQVGNEPLDYKSRFADLQRITYTAIKEVCPNCQVLIGGVPGMPPVSIYLDVFNQHYQSILDALGGKYVDVMDFHWYGAANGDYRGAKDVYERIRGVLRADGFPEIPVWITEMGAYSGAPTAFQGLTFPPQTERQQAEDYFKRFVYSLSFGVKKVFPAFGLMEGFKHDGGYFDFTGLIYDGIGSGDLGLGVKKLGYYTYKKMTELLEGSDWNNIQIVQESGNLRVYQFTKSNRTIYAAWWDYFDDPGYVPGAKVSLSLSGLEGATAIVTEVVPRFATGKEVVDYADAFNRSSMPITNRMLSLNLGDSPIVIEIQP